MFDLWVVVVDEVQVDPQFPHGLKSVSEPQTEERKEAAQTFISVFNSQV